MAKKKSKRRSKQSSKWWHWLLIAAGAFLLYQGLEHFLAPVQESPKKLALKSKEAKKPKSKTATPAPSVTPSPLATPSGGPVAKWDFNSAARFLPTEAYPDNYTALPLGEHSGLLAYAKVLSGKKPGPQGLTNTQPGLKAVQWNGKTYDEKDLDFDAVKSELENFKLVGLPQPERRPWIDGETKVFPMKLFFTDQTRLAVAFATIDAAGPHWASVIDAKGKSSPAVFLQGTTETITRKVRREAQGGKSYIISERGSLDLTQPEAGYKWRVEAYAWNGKDFVFDKAVSAKLTQEKSAQ